MDIVRFADAVAARRGSVGVRAAAGAAGVSPATLSRVENGNTPDMETFEKLCRWMGADPRQFLSGPGVDVVAAVQFKKAAAVAPQTAQALGELVTALFGMIKDELEDDPQT